MKSIYNNVHAHVYNSPSIEAYVIATEYFILWKLTESRHIRKRTLELKCYRKKRWINFIKSEIPHSEKTNNTKTG